MLNILIIRQGIEPGAWRRACVKKASNKKNYLWQRPLSSNKSAARSSVFDNDSIIMEKRYVTVTFFPSSRNVETAFITALNSFISNK